MNKYPDAYQEAWRERDKILGRNWSALRAKGVPFNQHLPTITLYYWWQEEEPEYWWSAFPPQGLPRRTWYEPIEDEI